MKLLFDQNLSVHLVDRLAEQFPGSTHVQSVGLDRAPDLSVWDFARQNDLAIVTKDSDFNDLSALLGHPPKVVWLRLGNCTTSEVESTLRRNHAQILDFFADPEAGTLVLF